SSRSFRSRDAAVTDALQPASILARLGPDGTARRRRKTDEGLDSHQTNRLRGADRSRIRRRRADRRRRRRWDNPEPRGAPAESRLRRRTDNGRRDAAQPRKRAGGPTPPDSSRPGDGRAVADGGFVAAP